MEWMIMPLRRYADFSGRSCRREYWMFTLLNVIVIFALALIVSLGMGLGSIAGDVGLAIFAGIGGLVFGIYGLAVIVPSIAVQVRRFHDQDKSGWFVLLAFIPYLGGLILLVFMLLEGTRGPNRFGPDPLDPYNADVFG